MSAQPRRRRSGHVRIAASWLLVLGGGLPPHLAIAQEAPDAIEGRWAGKVLVLGMELAFSVTFETSEGALSATMDIPSQALGLSLQEVSYDGATVHFELDASIGRAVWDGTREGDIIEGEFVQGGARGTFSIERSAENETGEEADSEPVPYREVELGFENGDVRLEGTLTLPESEGPFPAVVMITGSGPQNRDEELLGFPVFRVIADHLTRSGIAVLRYDDRGVGGSTGSVSESTTSDFADDALAAISRLAEHPEMDPARIGLVGHSEGGVVAPLAASRSDAVKFAVLLAGTSVTGEEIIYEQSALIARAAGAGEEAIAETNDFQRRVFAAVSADEDLTPYREELETELRNGIAELPEEQRSAIADVDEYVENQLVAQIDRLASPWFRFFLTHDPAIALRGTRVPVLALFGELDLQVAPSQNRGPMAEALAGNPDATIEVIPEANHLFQAATTGSPTEYATLEKAFVPGFLERISDWILARFGG